MLANPSQSCFVNQGVLDRFRGFGGVRNISILMFVWMHSTHNDACSYRRWCCDHCYWLWIVDWRPSYRRGDWGVDAEGCKSCCLKCWFFNLVFKLTASSNIFCMVAKQVLVFWFAVFLAPCSCNIADNKVMCKFTSIRVAGFIKTTPIWFLVPYNIRIVKPRGCAVFSSKNHKVQAQYSYHTSPASMYV